METVFYRPNFGVRLNDSNTYVMGKKYMLSLLSSIIVLCNRHRSSKITSYFEMFWTEYFRLGWQNISTYFRTFSRLIDQLLIYFLGNNIRETFVANKLSLLMMTNSKYSKSIKSYENLKYFIFDDSYVNVPDTAA